GGEGIAASVLRGAQCTEGAGRCRGEGAADRAGGGDRRRHHGVGDRGGAGGWRLGGWVGGAGWGGGRGRAEGGWRGPPERVVAGGRLARAAADERVGRIGLGTDWAALADVDLVIEAVFEEMEVKLEVFRRLDQLARPGTVLATNTSYLDVNRIARETKRPQN